MEDAFHKHSMAKCFKDKKLAPKDIHHISESIWKNG